MTESKHNIEKRLIDRAGNGDEEAFRKIYLLLKDPIYGFAYRMINQGTIAEEITQEVFMHFVRNPETYDYERGTLFSFLCGVARNRILNHLKKSGTKFESNSIEQMDSANFAQTNGTSPLKKLLNKEFSSLVIQSIEKLPHYQKEAIILRELNELSYMEIARITETDLDITRSRIYRGRRNLAKMLTPYLATEKEVNYEM